MRQRRWTAVALLSVSALWLAACSGGSDSSSAASSTSTTKASAGTGTAKVTSFDVPTSVKCTKGQTSTTVSVKYATAGAKKQQLLVDGRPTPLSSSSGSLDAPVHCDSLPHTFVIVAYDSGGRYTSLQKLVSTSI